MSATERLVARLKGAKQIAPDKWKACCPAHPDKTPSLDVRDASGRVLVCCHAGCSAEDVVQAVGLTLADLFDQPLAHHMVPVRDPMRPRIDAAKLLADIRHEAMVTVIITEKLARGEKFTDAEHKRLIRAAATINAAVSRSIQAEPPEMRRLRRGEGRPA